MHYATNKKHDNERRISHLIMVYFKESAEKSKADLVSVKMNHQNVGSSESGLI